MDTTDDETADDEQEQPTLRQVVHSATGDRDAEAKALADRTDDATEDDARQAVRKAHGDLGVDATPPDHDIATPADARAQDTGARDEPDADADE